jgi:signal transduction histidine kinase
VPEQDRTGTGGFGIVGMRERARSVGGTLDAAPRTDGPGFAVTAVLPLAAPHPGEGVPVTRRACP